MGTFNLRQRCVYRAALKPAHQIETSVLHTEVSFIQWLNSNSSELKQVSFIERCPLFRALIARGSYWHIHPPQFISSPALVPPGEHFSLSGSPGAWSSWPGAFSSMPPLRAFSCSSWSGWVAQIYSHSWIHPRYSFLFFFLLQCYGYDWRRIFGGERESRRGVGPHSGPPGATRRSGDHLTHHVTTYC